MRIFLILMIVFVSSCTKPLSPEELQQKAIDANEKSANGSIKVLVASSMLLGAMNEETKDSFLSSALGNSEKVNGFFTKAGYHYYIYLPSESEAKYWIAYAWPVEYAKTGNKVFVVNETGLILYTKNEKNEYSGENNPAANSALSKGNLSQGTGNDGEKWRK